MDKIKNLSLIKLAKYVFLNHKEILNNYFCYLIN